MYLQRMNSSTEHILLDDVNKEAGGVLMREFYPSI